MQATTSNIYSENGLNPIASSENGLNAQSNQMSSNILDFLQRNPSQSTQIQMPQPTQSITKLDFNPLSLLAMKTSTTKSTDIDTDNQMDSSYKFPSACAYEPYSL